MAGCEVSADELDVAVVSRSVDTAMNSGGSVPTRDVELSFGCCFVEYHAAAWESDPVRLAVVGRESAGWPP